MDNMPDNDGRDTDKPPFFSIRPLQAQDLDMEELFRRRFFILISFVSIPALVVFGINQLLRQAYLYGILDSFLACYLCASMIFLTKIKRGANLYRIGMALVGGIFLLWVNAGGTQGQPSIMLWVFVYPILTFFLLGRKEGLLWTFLLLAGCGIIFAFPGPLGSFHYVPEFKVRLVAVMVMLTAWTYIYELSRIRFRDGMQAETRRLEKEKERLALEMVEREKAEAELKKTQEELEQRVRERTQALAKSEESYRMVVENAQDLIFTVDGQGRLEWVNEYGLAMFGYTMEEILGRPWRDMVIPRDLPRIESFYRELFSSQGTKVSGLEYRCLDKGGKPNWLSLNARVFYDGKGRFLREYGVARNITAQKNLEARLQQAQKMEAIGTLAGGIAHDFNNMLMGIQGRASIMMMRIPQDDPNREHLKAISDLVRSSAALTGQLLGIARGGKYDPKPTDLNGIIQRVADMFGRTRKEITIQLELQDGLDAVEVDRSQIEQVFLNLFVNAWQAMPGGGSLTVATRNVILDGDEAGALKMKPGPCVKVTVQDTGVGMDENTRKRAFDPFFTTKGTARGTGLGLSSAYGILANHGGIIAISSKEGQGTLFTIHLPASSRAILPEAASGGEVVYGQGVIMLVDDEDNIIRTGTELLEALGYKVLAATGGNSALEMYAQHHASVDLVILDIVMPDMGGNFVYERLKAVNPDLKVLISSGYSSDGKAEDILKQGANGFIQKPFTVGHLSRKIQEIIGPKNNQTPS